MIQRWVMREDRFAKRSSRKVTDPVELAPDDRGVNDKNETVGLLSPSDTSFLLNGLVCSL